MLNPFSKERGFFVSRIRETLRDYGAVLGKLGVLLQFIRKRNMKITTIKQAVALEDLIGPENVEASRKLLTDGGELWVFQSQEELEADTELTDQEKTECQKRFVETGGKYAGWYRAPQKEPESGFTASSNMDVHGNVQNRCDSGLNYQASH